MLILTNNFLVFVKNYILIAFIILAVSVKAQQSSKVMHPAPVIAWQVTGLCYGDTSYFQNNTTGEVTDSWTIYAQTASGDSLIFQDSTINRSIKFKFPKVGTYRVQLDADNGHLVTLARYITYDSVPHANFDFQECNSQFTNFSSCFTSCFWDFGDGYTSTQANPAHFYEVTGTFPVTLKIWNGNRADSTEVDASVFSTNTILGTFKYTYEKDSLSFESDSVLFVSDDSTGTIYYGYHWAFGDGATADLNGFTGGKRIRHHYDFVDSTYYVFLLVKTFCFFSYSEQAVYVPDTASHSSNPSLNIATTTVIFPNPNTQDNLIHLVSNRKNDITDVKIMDCVGQILNSPLILKPDGYDIDMSVFPKGLYIIRIYFGSEIVSQKLIKQ